jgi:RecJ-like exonuclease
MRCPDCDGVGYVIDVLYEVTGEGKSLNYKPVSAGMIPCKRCAGSGVAHCCEGDICNE